MKKLLETHHLKATKQRISLLEVIFRKKEVTMKELIISLPKINQSTIYRILNTLLKKDIINKEINYLNETVYSFKEKHKHYLNCIECHKKQEIKTCPFDCEEVEGFKIINHSLTIDGICEKCQKKDNVNMS